MAKIAWTKNQVTTEREFPRFRRYVIFSRFMKYVRIGNPDECWEWLGTKDDDGYGRFYWSERDVNSAPVASYELFVGKRRKLCVCHSCDNPGCVNPRHLWLGTRRQNSQDMVMKGRAPKNYGDRNPRALLTNEQAEEVRELYATGNYKQKELAERFGVSRQAISAIVTQVRYKNRSKSGGNLLKFGGDK